MITNWPIVSKMASLRPLPSMLKRVVLYALIASCLISNIHFACACQVQETQAPEVRTLRSTEILEQDNIASWAIEDETRRVFAAGISTRYIYELAFDSGDLVRKIRLSKAANSISVHRGHLLCTHKTLPMVTLIDLGTNRVLKRLTINGGKLPFQLHDVTDDSRFALVTAKDEDGKTMLIRIDTRAGVEFDQVHLNESLSRVSISADGQVLVGKAEIALPTRRRGGPGGYKPKLPVNKNENLVAFHIPDANVPTESATSGSATRLGKFEVEPTDSKKLPGQLSWLVDKTKLQSLDGKKVNTRTMFKLDSEFVCVKFKADRSIFAAINSHISYGSCKLILGDYSGVTSDSLETELEEFECKKVDAQYFGTARETFFAIGNATQLRIVNISGLANSAGKIFPAPLKPRYQVIPGSLLTVDLSPPTGTESQWEISVAPDQSTLENNVLSIPASSLPLGMATVELSIKDAGTSQSFSSIIDVGHLKSPLGFFPTGYSVSADHKVAAFCGRSDIDLTYQLVVVDLTSNQILKRIDLDRRPMKVVVGQNYIFCYGSRLHAFKRSDFSKAPTTPRTIASSFMALADGKIIYQSRNSEPHLLLNEIEFVENRYDRAAKVYFWKTERSLFRTGNGYSLNQIVGDREGRFLRGPITFTALNEVEIAPYSYRWNSPMINGSLVTHDHPTDPKRFRELMSVAETNSQSIEQLPLAFGISSKRDKDKLTVEGVFRDLVNFSDLHRVAIFSGTRPNWFSDFKSRYLSSKQDPPKFGSPLINLLTIDSKQACILVGSNLLYVPVPNFSELEFPKTLLLATSPIESIELGQSTSFKLNVEHNSGDCTFRLRSPPPGVTLTDDRVNVDSQAVWNHFRDTEMNNVSSYKGKTYEPYSQKLLDENTKLFRQIYGRKPNGIPAAVTLQFDAVDATGNFASTTRSVVIEVQYKDFEQLRKAFNLASFNLREQKFRVLAQKHFGGLLNEINQLSENSKGLAVELDELRPSITASTKAIRNLPNDRVEASRLLLAATTELQTFITSSKPSDQTTKRIDKIASKREQVLQELDELGEEVAASRFQVYILLALASLFFLSSLIFLYRSPTVAPEE